MRKIVLFIGVTIFCIVCVVTYSNKENTEMVFAEESNNYDIYLLDLSKQSITTNNLDDYFDNITILEIYPNINPIYKNLIKLNSYSYNTAISNKKNTSNFMSEYSRRLEKNGLKNEELRYYINGIKINKIKVYTSSKKVNKLINKYSINLIK